MRARVPFAIRYGAAVSALLAAAALCLGSCAKLMGYADGGQPAPIRAYPDGSEGLKALFQDVLEAAKRDERERVHDLLATLIMSPADFEALFGAERSQLYPKYQAMMGTLANRGAVELVAQIYERKLDTIEVISVRQAEDAPSRAVEAALKSPVAFYSVRVRRQADTKGLRYDLFFYRGGKWLTGNLLGKLLTEASPVDAAATTKP